MSRLRHFSLAIGLVALALLLPVAVRGDQAPTAASAAPVIRLSADHIAFYFDRFLVEADGNVRVTIGDRTVMTGQTFSMDLKLNRLLLAGSVTLTSPSGTQTGAAISDYLDFGRVYFIPILSEPDRWTYLNGDYSHPAKGREMPGDAFALPDLSHDKPYLIAHGAAIVPHQFVNFRGSVLTIAGHNLLPTGAYYINFSNNRYLAENSLTGATYDATLQFAGSTKTISAIHFRYDPTNKAYASFEQHIAGTRGYAVFSVNPATEDSKYYNLFTSYMLNKSLQVQTFTQYHLQQFGVSEPLAGQDVSTISLTQAFRQSSVQLYFEQYNLCNTSVYPNTDPNHSPGSTWCGVGAFRITNYTHPSQVAVSISIPKTRIAKTPLSYAYGYGLGNIHDAYTLENFGGANYNTIWNHYLSLTTYLPSITIGSRNPIQTVYFNASYSAQRTWYSVPHHVDVDDGVASLSRFFGPKVTASLSYEVHQTGDYYNGGQQLMYSPYVPVVNGTAFPSYSAFQGIATFRTLTFAANFTSSPDFSFILTARKHDDFPIAEPGLFPQPVQTYPFNYYLYNNTLGEPPYDISGDARIRLTPTLAIDIARSYFFNFGTQRWSPSFEIQVSQ
jgi:hypothetical protein